MGTEIRLATKDDLPALEQVLKQTDLFPPDMLEDMMSPFLEGKSDSFWMTCLHDGSVSGFTFTAPEDLTDGTWNMLAIAVLPSLQTLGLGRELIRHTEKHLRALKQRLIIADTSGTSAFAGTRQFYDSVGYREVARIPDFWAEGDNKIVFARKL